MAGYRIQKKSDAALLALVQSEIDASATAVNGATGEVTTDTTWTTKQKEQWCFMYHDCYEAEEVVAV